MAFVLDYLLFSDEVNQELVLVLVLGFASW